MKTYKIGVVLIVSVFTAVVSAVPGDQQPALGVVAAVGSLASTASPLASDVETAITTLERDWAMAIVTTDAMALDWLIADDFNGTSPTAHTFTKTMAIQELKSGKYVVTSMDLDEISVNLYGDVAVAFTSQRESSRYAGKDTSGHYHFTDVWVKRNGRWQVVASHGTRFTEGH